MKYFETHNIYISDLYTIILFVLYILYYDKDISKIHVYMYSREKEGLLHKFEIDETAKGTKLPKADPKKTIKCFSRPAAGLIMTDMKQLRPAPVLLSTIKYLFTKYAYD